jgi:hypothetical protein
MVHLLISAAQITVAPPEQVVQDDVALVVACAMIAVMLLVGAIASWVLAREPEEPISAKCRILADEYKARGKYPNQDGDLR